MRRTSVGLDGKPVPYLYGFDCAEQVANAVLTVGPDIDAVLFVVDARVRTHARQVTNRLARHIRVEQFVVDATERLKGLPLVESLLEFAVGRGATRRTVVVAMGGGLVGNVAGLAAALLFRGVRLVHLPSTPVAAFDAVLSVKQGVNLSGGKNLCGAYHAPSLIACDLAWLSTIPRRGLLTGLAEMAKNVLAVVPDQEETFVRAVHRLPHGPAESFLDLCEVGLAAKTPYLAQDPRERREALVFEYGHTAGHALEFLSGGALGHGEAVAWGMLVAAELGRRLGALPDADVERHHRLVGLLEVAPAGAARALADPDSLRTVLARDNKRGYVPCGPDEVPMVLLASVGRPLTDTDGYPLTPVPVPLLADTVADVLGAVGPDRVRGGSPAR